MKKINKKFTNYILLENKGNNAPLIEIIHADNANNESEEIGFSISGIATTFGVRNENGGIFESGAFDKAIKDYFRKNKINMICPVEHNWDFDNRGIFTTIENDTDFLTVSVIFYKDCCSKYAQIKGQVQRGILQGFSTFGWIDEKGDAHLSDISLVANPADTGAKLFKNSTQYIGFENDEEANEQKEKEITIY